MRLLATNDDGIDALGLQALVDAATRLGDITVVAPVNVLSGCSHQVTTDQPFRVLAHEGNRYAVEGTPADCVRVGLHRLVPEAAWVLSGINHGGNLGADVWHSGTVAAVREAVLHGWPGIAVSHYRKRGLEYDWPRASRLITPLLADLMAKAAMPGSFWNVNIPHVEPHDPDPEVAFCRLDPTPLPLSFREEEGLLSYNGDYHQRRREPGADVDLCFGGRITITRIAIF